MKKNNKIIYGIVSLLAVVSITYLGTYYYYKDEIEFCEKNQELLKAIDDIKENFYLDVDEKEMTYNMISGLINGLDDRYTYYHTMNEVTENFVNQSITLESSGFQIDKDKTGNILVTEVKENSQAEKMGLQTGDLITDIDDVNVLETGYYTAIEELLGKDYTEMLLNIERCGQRLEINFVRRNIIEEYSDVTNKMLDEKTLYYCFNSFDESTADNFENTIKKNGSSDIENIIFDLRQNGGGDTKKCVEFFDLFSNSGNEVKVIYTKSGKEIVYSTSDGVKYDFDIVLLVSENTLSSGEIFSALFQDTGLGTIIGTQTGGKGVFQEKTMLDDFTSYSIVSGYYYVNDLPNYNNIGITPDVIIPMDNSLIGTDNDIQLKKAVDILSDAEN